MDKRIEQHYFKHAKKGVVLSVKDLKDYALKENIPVPPETELKHLRYLFKFLAIHSQWHKPSHYMSPTVMRLGNIYVDLAEFHPELRVHNKNCRYFLVAVDALSQKTMLLPFANKTQKTWEEGVKIFIDFFACVRNIISDRDSSVSGLEFQKRIYKVHSVRWIHLRSRSKAYLAERMIYTAKVRLQQCLDGNYPDLNWIQFLKPFYDDYNRQFVKHTRIRRMDVTKDNEMEVVRQQFGIEDVGHLFNSSTLSNFSPYMLKKLNLPFKHNDRVIISKSANYTLRKSSFSKVSQGTFSRKTYVIDRPVLKANADHFFTVAWKIYGLEGLFYTSEIRKANWIEDDPDRNEDKEREKKRRDKLKRKRDQQ